jgi:hypothetical protein
MQNSFFIKHLSLQLRRVVSCPLELVLARAVEKYVFRLGGSDYRFGCATRSKGLNGSSSTGSILGATT